MRSATERGRAACIPGRLLCKLHSIQERNESKPSRKPGGAATSNPPSAAPDLPEKKLAAWLERHSKFPRTPRLPCIRAQDLHCSNSSALRPYRRLCRYGLDSKIDFSIARPRFYHPRSAFLRPGQRFHFCKKRHASGGVRIQSRENPAPIDTVLIRGLLAVARAFYCRIKVRSVGNVPLEKIIRVNVPRSAGTGCMEP